MFESKQRSYTDLIEGILIGGSLAALTTFLLGTQKGKKLQNELLEKITHFRDDIEKAVKSPTARKVKRKIKKAIKGKDAAERKVSAKKAIKRGKS